MDRMLLIFPPGANPTYMPLGTALLATYIRREAPCCHLTVRDCNIALWNKTVELHDDFTMMDTFLRGASGDFYNRATYQGYQEAFTVLAGIVSDCNREMKNWLETGMCREEALYMYRSLAARALDKEQYDTIGFSVMFPAQVIPSLALARLMRSFLGESVRIIMGGAMISSLDVDALLRAEPVIDAVLRGEGEAGLAAFLNRAAYRETGGLSYREGAFVHHNGLPRQLDIEDIPCPDFSDFETGAYFNPVPVLPVLFSRGCRWRSCRFCIHNLTFGAYRSLRYESFVDRLERLQARHGVYHFYFADQYIGPDDLLGISNAILRRGLTLWFHTMGRPEAGYTPEVLRTAFRAGCRWISWGIETGSGKLLDICNKGTTVPVIEKVLVNAAEAGISNLAMMIFGLPGTDRNAFDDTLSFAGRVSPVVDAFTSSAFQLFARAPFYASRKRYSLQECDRETLVTINGIAVTTGRVFYMVRDSNGALYEPAHYDELKKWEQWKLWVRGGPTFFEHISSEHYLIFAAEKDYKNMPEELPDKPRKPAATPNPLARAS